MGPIYEITRAVEKRKEDRCTTMKNIQCKKKSTSIYICKLYTGKFNATQLQSFDAKNNAYTHLI